MYKHLRRAGLLYIPHGSDNTKAASKTFFFIPFFISHMVQIILLFILAVLHLCFTLYIPHGSDNTLRTHFVKCPLFLLFISHMVQIIHLSPSFLLRPLQVFISHMVQIIPVRNLWEKFRKALLLYIPHGSDNTIF